MATTSLTPSTSLLSHLDTETHKAGGEKMQEVMEMRRETQKGKKKQNEKRVVVNGGSQCQGIAQPKQSQSGKEVSSLSPGIFNTKGMATWQGYSGVGAELAVFWKSGRGLTCQM